MKACIIYGMAEGQWQGKLLRASLHKAGFSVTKSTAEADVIIAHSGGCYMLPESSKANLILLVGLPYWPGKHPIRSFQQKIREELKDLWWFKKTFFNTYYFISRPKRWLVMRQRWKAQALPAFEDIPIILVRNQHDYFMHPTDTLSLANAKNWSLKQVAGHHDDLWRNPKPYVKLIIDNVQ